MLNDKKIKRINKLLSQIEEKIKEIYEEFEELKEFNDNDIKDKVKGERLVIAINPSNIEFATKLKEYIKIYKNLDVNVHILKIIEPVKHILKDLLDIELNTIEELENKKDKINCNGNIITEWINILEKGIKKYLENDFIFIDKTIKDIFELTDENKFNVFIISDLRYDIEDWNLSFMFDKNINYFPIILKFDNVDDKKIEDFNEEKATYIINIKEQNIDKYIETLFNDILRKFLNSKK